MNKRDEIEAAVLDAMPGLADSQYATDIVTNVMKTIPSVSAEDMQTLNASLKLWGDTKRNAVIDWHTLDRIRNALQTRQP